MKRIILLTAVALFGAYVGSVFADVPGRPLPSGIVPNPGTQQQELANITAPGTYNVFDYPNFCAGCHGGSIDQNVSHYGNWAGSNMANSGRDPFFRANNLIVNADAYAVTGGFNGVGNICWRCHSPNGWYSARLDQTKGGRIDGTTIQQSLLASTDMQGISCEFCHRMVDNVTMKRADLAQNDPVWNMFSGATDWPHSGLPYPEGPIAGLPYGDTTFMFNNARYYQADLPGNFLMFFSDLPTSGTYTGQTYGVYPPGYTGPKGKVPAGQPATNILGQEIVYLPDGKSKIQFELPVGPPTLPDGTPDWDVNHSVSPRHATHMGGSIQNGYTSAAKYRYVVTAEMCGSCHDLTVPTLNSGMPEQRTYTEWKFSDYGRTNSPAFIICQDCHMREAQHEYRDGQAGTYKADPEKAGYFPYAKERPASALHRFRPANRDLGQILKVLNPDVDMEITGKATGIDTRTSTGVLSNRNAAWDRQTRYGEQVLRESAHIQVLSGPTPISGNDYEVQVKVTNLTGHALPSGYPDGRRAFITLAVKDASGTVLYQSGDYDNATAELLTAPGVPYVRAKSPIIDARVQNAVMTYEKRTGFPNGDGTYTIGESLLNPVIVFDNRLRPQGWDAGALSAGVRIVNYTGTETTAVPFNQPDRFGTEFTDANNNLVRPNWDTVTYRFTTTGTPASARAEFHYQSHTREFVEYLKDRNNTLSTNGSGLGGPKPQGTPNILDPNYPNVPNYLGDNINITSMTDIAGAPLQNNWGSLAYAGWLLTNKGAPFTIDADDTLVTAIPAAPASISASVLNPFTSRVDWSAVTSADGYVVEARFGTNTVDSVYGPTASWEKLAIVQGATTFQHDALVPNKTYGYRVTAYNGKSDVTVPFPWASTSLDTQITTATALPAAPGQLQINATTASSVYLGWYDNATDELGFIIERQDVPVNTSAPKPAFIQIAQVATPNLTTYTDSTVLAGRTYNYRVAAYNAGGNSQYNDNGAKEAKTPLNSSYSLRSLLTGTTYVNLGWNDITNDESGFAVEMSTGGATGPWTQIGTAPANFPRFSARGLTTKTNYWFRVKATGSTTTAYSNVFAVTTK